MLCVDPVGSRLHHTSQSGLIYVWFGEAEVLELFFKNIAITLTKNPVFHNLRLFFGNVSALKRWRQPLMALRISPLITYSLKIKMMLWGTTSGGGPARLVSIKTWTSTAGNSWLLLVVLRWILTNDVASWRHATVFGPNIQNILQKQQLASHNKHKVEVSDIKPQCDLKCCTDLEYEPTGV